MNLTKIKNECYEAMVEAIKSEFNGEGIDWAYNACATVDTNDGFIELVIDHHNDTSVEEALPDWDAIEEEWQEENPEEDEYEAHGFIDEADYLNWKYG